MCVVCVVCVVCVCVWQLSVSQYVCIVGDGAKLFSSVCLFNGGKLI